MEQLGRSGVARVGETHQNLATVSEKYSKIICGESFNFLEVREISMPEAQATDSNVISHPVGEASKGGHVSDRIRPPHRGSPPRGTPSLKDHRTVRSLSERSGGGLLRGGASGGCMAGM